MLRTGADRHRRETAAPPEVAEEVAQQNALAASVPVTFPADTPCYVPQRIGGSWFLAPARPLLRPWHRARPRSGPGQWLLQSEAGIAGAVADARCSSRRGSGVLSLPLSVLIALPRVSDW